MKRAEVVQGLILNSMCDDFENVDQVILRSVAEEGRRCGLAITRQEVVEGLRMLVEHGFAKAYDLSVRGASPFSGELQGMPDPEIIDSDSTYFYITKSGMDLHRANAQWWPFDDEEALRPDWLPPEQ